MILTSHTCENCQQKFANKSILTTHQQTCTAENPSLSQSKDAISNKVSQFNKGANAKGKSGKHLDDRTADSIHPNDVTDKSKSQRKTAYDINKVLSPDKSLSDTTDMKYETMSDKFSTISQNPYEIQATQFMEELSKKNPREKREAELSFVTKNIEKTTPVKFLVSEHWIENYTSYLNGESKTPPPAIDNTQLKHMVLTKTLPKNLYIINEHIWRFIHKMYSGGPEIKQNNKAISFYGGSVSDHLSETQTADTFSRSEGLESMRNSVLEPPMTPWYINTTPYLKPIGFANNSFYCYMNSCLQMLLGITELSQYIYQEKYKSSSNKEDQKFWKSMTEVVHGHFRNQTCLTPKLLRRLSYKMFDPNQQHDVHEFLNFLLSGMQDELNISPPKKEMEFKTPENAWNHYRKYNVSIVDNLLAGQLTSTVRCTNCKHVSTTFDPFLDLSLPIIPGQTKKLDDCLTAFQTEEDIDDSYRCEKCKITGKAKKKLHVHRWPKFLFVNFKRFQTHPKKIKIKEMITFPMSDWKLKDDSTKEVHSYSLIGVTVHYGPIDSGHYVCYTKRGDNWVFCDDESLTKVQESEVSTKEAYVLIYERENPLGTRRN